MVFVTSFQQNLPRSALIIGDGTRTTGFNYAMFASLWGSKGVGGAGLQAKRTQAVAIHQSVPVVVWCIHLQQ